MKKIDYSDIELIIKEAFPKAKLNCQVLELKLGDLEEWDSLGNFNLLLAFEEFYGIRFSINEISELKSVVQIIEAINHK